MATLFKYLFIIIQFVCLCVPMHAQFNVDKYDKLNFLLGTLDEYMGYDRSFVPARGQRSYQKVDIFYKEELKNTFFMQDLFKTQYPDLYIENNFAPKGIVLFSPKLSQEIDRFFEYKPSGNYSLVGDTVYAGTIKSDMIITEQQKRSYILGILVRAGYKKDGAGVYTVGLPNAGPKAAFLSKLLQELECEDVQYTISQGWIPVGHYVRFKPSIQVDEIIDDAYQLRSQIAAIDVSTVAFKSNGRLSARFKQSPLDIWRLTLDN